MVDILNWVGKIHGLLFEYSPIYRTSKKLHEGKSIDHKDRATTVNELSKVGINPKIGEIGKIRENIKKKLSENVRRTISELVKI